MTHYRVYCLDAEGRIYKRQDLECLTDDEARVAAARIATQASPVELWSGVRFLGQVSALQAAPNIASAPGASMPS